MLDFTLMFIVWTMVFGVFSFALLLGATVIWGSQELYRFYKSRKKQ